MITAPQPPLDGAAHPTPAWIWRMAWRDSRGSRTHLLLSMAALAIGIAALVAIRSFSLQLDQALERQMRNLLGADFSIHSMQPFSEQAEAFLADLPGESVRETRFYSMAVFERTGDMRLSHVRALEDEYPFYGELRVEPPEATFAFLEDPSAILVEESLMLQFDAQLGDPVQIGARTFHIAGRLLNVTGEAPATSTFIGPRLYISLDALPETELIRDGSLAIHHMHFRLDDDRIDPEELRQTYRTEMADLRLEMETVVQRRELLGQALTLLYRYLNLGALIALLLGGIGCASSIQLYARKKRTNVSILRCLGTSARMALWIYVVQIAAAALIGAIAGAMLGSVVQWMIPMILADVLPVEVTPGWSFASVSVSVLMGLGISIAFTLWPLLILRRVPPLAALRPALLSQRGQRFDPAQLLVGGILFAALLVFSIVHTDRLTHGVITALAIGLVFVLLATVARLMMWGTRLLIRQGWSFEWRQGVANIHRPFNQTTVLLLALGLGTFLLCTLALTQDNVLRQFSRSDQDGQPNLILFDVQPDQVEAVARELTEQGLELLETAPIVTMRLTHVDGRSVGALRDDPALDLPHWVLFREYRTTYRATLDERDRIIRGRWEQHTDPAAPIPISIEEVMADYLQIGVGTRLTFTIQGVQLDCEVRSIRRVDWRELRTNFFVIFPDGVLEDAPQHFAMVIRAPTVADAARLQQTVIAEQPNISAVDLRMVVEAIDDIVGKAAFVVRFMAMFSVFTGLLVLGGTVVAGRYDRHEENALLRTLGATRKQLNQIMLAEYVVLGGIAATTGLLLALAASWAMARWVFQMSFVPALGPLFGIPALVLCLTVLLGLALTRVVHPTRGT